VLLFYLKKYKLNVSVVIPVFNRLSFVQKAIDSVLAQSYSPKEIIVVDDGSSEDICSLEKKYKNIKIISYQPNKGVSFARNTGIKKASCEWIAFLDSDDIWHKDKLQEQVFFHKQNTNIKISQTQEIWIRNNIEIKQPKTQNKPHLDLFLPSLQRCLITPSSVMINKSVFDDVGVFDENMDVCEDYDLWLRIAKKYQIGLIDKKLITKYGGHSDQLSFKHWGMDRFRVIALEKHKEDEKYGQDVKKILSEKYTILINGAIKRNKQKEAKIYQDKLNKII